MMWRAVTVALCMLAAAGLSMAMKPTKRADPARAQVDQIVPQHFGGWQVDPTVVPIAPAPDVQANLDQIYDKVVSRAYLGPNGEHVMLSIAYGGEQSDSLKAHRQEVCYTAQGFQVREVRSDQLSMGTHRFPVVRMVAQKGVRVEPVTYWFTMGDEVVLTRGERLIAQLKHGLRGNIPDGMLVRISNISDKPTASFAVHDRFVRDLVAALQSDQSVRFVGTSKAQRPG
jgi:EpsI family protein